MMARLIDADVLLEKLSRMIDYCKNDNKVSGLTALFQVGDAIIDCPTVDAVEVVRCKDCKHFVRGEPYDPCECMKWTVKFGVAYTEPDGYCHKAERKDND